MNVASAKGVNVLSRRGFKRAVLAAFLWTVPALFGDALPYFYVSFLTILLVHRSVRDDKRCAAKYGAAWDEYRRRVRFRIVPGIF